MPEEFPMAALEPPRCLSSVRTDTGPRLWCVLNLMFEIEPWRIHREEG